MYTALLRMAYLGDGISSDYGDQTDEEGVPTEEGELEGPPPVVVPPDEPEEEE